MLDRGGSFAALEEIGEKCYHTAMEKSKFSVVLVTVPDAKLAESLAEGLVKGKLAACVNVIPNLTSHYYWEGKLHKDPELLLVIKTRSAVLPDLIGFVKENHGAKVPEIISLPIAEGYQPYLDWIGANTVLTQFREEGQLSLP